jgi:hypothetical protein
MKIRPVDAELFHEDLTKLLVGFRNFAIAPKTQHKLLDKLIMVDRRNLS